MKASRSHQSLLLVDPLYLVLAFFSSSPSLSHVTWTTSHPLLATMSDLDILETQRVRLEDAVAKLRKSLQHWRTWDAEYDGLKEELEKSDQVQNESDCVRNELIHSPSAIFLTIA